MQTPYRTRHLTERIADNQLNLICSTLRKTNIPVRILNETSKARKELIKLVGIELDYRVREVLRKRQKESSERNASNDPLDIVWSMAIEQLLDKYSRSPEILRFEQRYVFN